jgi:aryl-alcohol dehydrogenase-like predicted oxidoreductase
MEYRRLGKCGIQVSELSLGSWLTFGALTVSLELIHTCS